VQCPSVPRMECVAHGSFSHLLLLWCALWCGMVWDGGGGAAMQRCCEQCSKLFTVKAGERHRLCTPCNTARKKYELPAVAAPSPPQPLFPPHAGNHAHLPLIERAAVVVLRKEGHSTAKTWLHSNGVTALDFPPWSPDLNPIEDVWPAMDRAVETHNATDEAELEAAVKAEWEAVSPEALAKLAHSMPKRLEEVIAHNGHKIHY